MHFSSEMKTQIRRSAEQADQQNNRNSKYEPTVFSGGAGDSADKRRNRARPCFQLPALGEECGDAPAKRQTFCEEN